MSRTFAATLSLVLLAGCGGGGGGGGGTTGNGSGGGDTGGDTGGGVFAALAGIPTVPEGGRPGPDVPFGLHDYTLVSSTRISRTVFEYVYHVDASNWSGADVALTATLSSRAPNVTIVDGELGFGDLPWGVTAPSTDTFAIRVDRSSALDTKLLLWTTHATALPPTTFALIDQARAAGTIDAETALVYKLYAEFADSRLPAQYIGRDDGAREGRALYEARRTLATLSPATQALVAPFLMRPTEAGSWNELQAGEAAVQAAGGRPHILATAAAAAVAWDSVVVDIGGTPKARVWWQPVRRPQDEGRARAFRDELELYLWEKITDHFGEPLPDDVIPGFGQNPNPYGPDGLVDIYLTGIARAGELAAWASCDGSPRSGFVLMDTTSGNETIGHELMHVIIDGYQLQSCVDDYHWMNEATATWVQQFAYPGDNQEQYVAPRFLGAPEDRLNLDEGLAGHHQYGAYLWFLSLAGANNDPWPVRDTWTAASSRDSIGAIDAVNGGFEQNWRPFLARNWNRVAGVGAPHRDYHYWDHMDYQVKEHHGDVQNIALPVSGGLRNPLDHDLLPLASQYDHFDFTGNERIRQIWIKNDYAGGDPRARLYAIVKVKGQDWQPAADWTPDPRHFFCRDMPTEDLEELVLILSNLDLAAANDFTANTPRLGGPDTMNESPVELIASSLPCHDWRGTISYETSPATDPGIAETTTSTTTDLLFKLDRAASSSPATMGAISYYRIASGVVRWRITQDFDFCTSADVSDAFPAEGQLVVSLGNDTLFYGISNTAEGTTQVAHVQCEGGPTDFHYQFAAWAPGTGFLSLPINATRIQGIQEVNEGTGDGWRWTLDKVVPPPP